MSTKKIKHFEEPKTKDRASMLAFQAQLRGETEAITYSGKNVWQGFEGLDL